jgi:hypothetical protein
MNPFLGRNFEAMDPLEWHRHPPCKEFLRVTAPATTGACRRSGIQPDQLKTPPDRVRAHAPLRVQVVGRHRSGLERRASRQGRSSAEAGTHAGGRVERQPAPRARHCAEQTLQYWGIRR